MHLAGVGVLHRGDDEARPAQSDLPLRPAVHRQRQLPFPHVEHPREMRALGAARAPRLPWGERKEREEAAVIARNSIGVSE